MEGTYFKDLKVVELASVLAGPAVAMFFAELGAQVIKIENKTADGDLTRKWKLPSEPIDSNVSAYFSSVNYRKQYLPADFTNASEFEQVMEKLAAADVVIVNFKKGDEHKFQLSYDDLCKINPHIIYAHITGYGTQESKTAFDVVLQAETGFMQMNGTPESGPVKMPVALIDILAAHQLKEGILLALHKKQATGKGSYVHTSLYESAIASLANQASNYLMCAHIPQPMGTLHPNIAPYGEMLHTSDNQWIVLAVGTHVQFQALCNALGIVPDERFNTNTSRVKHRLVLQQLLNEKSIKMTCSKLEEILLKHQVPHGRVNSLDQVFENPLAQQMIREEIIEGQLTRRVSTIAFSRDFLKDR